MSKFCVHCGKTLEEGAVCECRANNAAVNVLKTSESQAAATVVVQHQHAAFGDYFKEMFKTYVDFLKRPVTVLKAHIQKADFGVGVFFIVLQAILTAVIFLEATNKVKKLMGMFGSYIGEFVGGDMTIFIKLFLIVVANLFLLGGITFGVGKMVLKDTKSFKSLMAGLGIATIPFSTAIIVSALLFTILPKVVPFILGFGAILTFISTFVGFDEALGQEKDKNVYVVSSAYILYYVALVIVTLLMI